ncbi:UvrD-helicase domain-containing protein [Streptomonospora nanhaiensis]|uniref:UvrD-helicase domain-containing protein n=1 Tax=Streptomonospora nanhaiensis TaxID=1323731 RepID=UPI001C992178|nr:UvrD-helicase domain-containing protein [Streptomonospora nanhaiensis]MBX9387563.1 AAA family ATPase [Streptomonospora nanhaiensis]
MTEEKRLTDAQRRLVQAPADARTLVTAGPGAGKTFCLIHRITHLLEEEGLDPADVLVLSFSRAAVREIRDRAAEGGAATDVDVRTFDSYATWLLSEVRPEGSWQQRSFDERIREATALLVDDPDAAELVADVRHLIVDEVQDLVGDRAELVKALMGHDVEGFTLLGDPAQGIYGFQLKTAAERVRGSAALYEWIRNRFTDDLVEIHLSENFRAREPEARVALAYGSALGAVDADLHGLHNDLRTALLGGDTLGTLTDAAPVLARFRTPTAVLCRTNGQALLVSQELRAHGVRHTLRRSAQDRVLPAWVAGLFREPDSKSLRRAEVDDLLLSAGVADVDRVWALLKRMDTDRRGESLNLVAVRGRLARGEVPDELTAQPVAPVVVSTVHRAKGLEFDQVVVVDPGAPRGDGSVEDAEYARVLYVAMTRPRDLLIHVAPVEGPASGRLTRQRDGRWAVVGFKRGRLGFEVRGDDVDADEPAGTLGFSDDPAELQRYMATRVGPDDEVELVRAPGGEDRPGYLVRHRGRLIGAVSATFMRGLRTLVPGRGPLPERIEGLHVEAVETVVGREASGANAGLGWSGVWLRPRIVGLGRLVWGGKEET